MVGLGVLMVATGLVSLWLRWRGKLYDSPRFARWCLLMGPSGFVALLAGWFVTELGRQPWIMRGAMRTKEAVTPFPHLAAPFWMFTLVYLFLAVAVVYLLSRQLRAASPNASEVEHDH